MLYLLCGPKGSGKTTLVNHVRELSIPAFEASPVIWDMVREQQYQDVDALIAHQGKDRPGREMASRLHYQIEQSAAGQNPFLYVQNNPLVVEGIRIISALRYFRDRFRHDVRVVGLYIDDHLAHKHHLERKKDEQKYNDFDEFMNKRQIPDYEFGLREILDHHVDDRIIVRGDVEKLKADFMDVVARYQPVVRKH